MILFYYILSIILCKYTNSPIIGIAICVLLSLLLWMTLIESMAAFAGAVCAFQIKDSSKFWKIILINVPLYLVGTLIVGQSSERRIIVTFVLAWGSFVAKWLGYF